MRVLLIFDQRIDLEELKKRIDLLKPSYISLFSLTAQWHLIRDIEHFCQLNSDAKIGLIESAKLIDREVDILRKKISQWSAELGEQKINGKSIKEWFLIPKGEVSTWWFSLLSEKSTLKTDIFSNIAQLGAIDKVISSETPVLCISSIYRKDLLLAIEALCKKHSVNILHIPQLKRKMAFKKHVTSYLARSSIFNSSLKALICVRVNIFRATMTKLVMGSIKKRARRIDNSILFVSYFPSVDKESAKEGNLKNKYAIPLQEKLAQMKKKIIWIWMFAPLDGHSFRDACKLAAKFAKNGETNFFLDEFLSFKVLVKSLFLWFRQVRIFIGLKRKIPGHILYENLSIPEAAILIRKLMVDSFAGWTALEGILYFELYKEVFSHFSMLEHCIYYNEMHAWEKALNAAKRLKAPTITTVGFQHTFVSRNYFQYFHHPSEMVQHKKSLSLPLPDILACNGDVSLNLMARSGYPDIRKVEAIRHLYLASYLNNSNFPHKDKVVLVSGSFNREETSALISLCCEAFPDPKGFKVWLKGHPSLPLEEILEELSIHYDVSDYIIKYDPISELIKVASVVLIGRSSVALEALTSGCKVILTVFPNCIFLNPLGGFDKFSTKVYNPQQLRQVICKIMAKNERKRDLRDIKDFIANYWCLDKSLQRWEQILS